MTNNILFNYILILSIGIGISLFSPAYSQDFDLNMADLSNVRVDDLSDDQVRQFINRAESEGMTMQELEAEAVSRGMPYDEISKLRSRIEGIQEVDTTGDRRADETRVRTDKDNDLLTRRDPEEYRREPDTNIFGEEMFKRANLTFEPSLNIPTPQNYLIGTGDELVIDVWGAAQQSFGKVVSSEGQIKIQNLAPIQVSGLTIDQASEIIISRLSNIYSGLKGPNPNTFAQVNLGNIRSINVTISGDVFMPGNYTLPAFATAFNALYLSGGPSRKGSFRDISVIRDGEVISNIDLYDFLIKGETSRNVRLQDEDLIFIKPYSNSIILTGEVKRPFIYELKENETMADLIKYSGGFSSDAYRKNLVVSRKTDTEKKLLNVNNDLFSSFIMKDGDSISVNRILDRYENRVTIRGAVFRGGEYALQEGMKLTDLVNKAEGITEDAFLNRAAIYRLQDNLQVEVIDVNLKEVIEGDAPDILLKREDVVMISSILELQQERTVRIMGEVQDPGAFIYAENISLGELIRKAGGLTDAASLARVEVARRIKDKDALYQQSKMTEIFSFPLDEELSLDDEASSFRLQPFDMVFVRRSPGYRTQKIAQISGEVHFPGNYAITEKDERISDLVKRAGGITDEAYLQGATLIRQVEDTQEEIIRHLQEMETNDEEMIVETPATKEHKIGIDLERILNNPYSRHDLTLMEGDVLEIPVQLETVRVSGALLHPVTVRYQRGMPTRNYISRAGGFADNANKSKVFVIHPNGSVDRTRNFLLFRSYPSVEPGSEIIVPQKPEREPRSLQEVLAISSSVSSIALVIVSIINQMQ